MAKESAIASNIHYGALVADGSIDQRIKIVKLLGAEDVRYSVNLDRAEGADSTFDKIVNAGLSPIANLNWNNRSNKFVRPSEFSQYEAKLIKYLKKNKPKVVVIENEPTTEVFWDDEIEFYIDQLEFATSIVRSLGIIVTDGAIHIKYINAVMKANGKKLKGNELKVQKLIEAFKYIPLDLINFHTALSGSSVAEDSISKAADWVRKECNKDIMSNEWHVENASGSLMVAAIKAWKAAHPVHCLIYSSRSGKNAPINSGDNLTPIGEIFRDEIAK